MKGQFVGSVMLVLVCACSEETEGSAATAGSGGSGASSNSDGGSAGGPVGGGGAGGMPCTPSLPVDEDVPELLSETGLYVDVATSELAAYVDPFEPAFALWSDAATKTRWVYLPECSQIDTSDMDDWSLPVGTRMWKEFRSGAVRVETRLIERTGTGAHDFIFAAYVWNASETEAVRTPEGLVDALGTTHDVPDEDACGRCHGSSDRGGGRPSRALGLSAIQLSHDGDGLTLAALIADDRLSESPTDPFVVPGDAMERAALGYLHANCGHCHNDTVDRIPQVDLAFWLKAADATVQTTSAYLTAVGQPTVIFNDQNVTARIEPGVPASSAVWFRMNERGNNAQMPPLASEVTDATGLAAVQAWIASLP